MVDLLGLLLLLIPTLVYIRGTRMEAEERKSQLATKGEGLQVIAVLLYMIAYTLQWLYL